MERQIRLYEELSDAVRKTDCDDDYMENNDPDVQLRLVSKLQHVNDAWKREDINDPTDGTTVPGKGKIIVLITDESVLFFMMRTWNQYVVWEHGTSMYRGEHGTSIINYYYYY